MTIVHPFKINLFEMNTGRILNDSVQESNLNECIPLLTMNFANRALTIGDVFEFGYFYFIFSGYKEHIHHQLPEFKTFNFLFIEKDSKLLKNEIINISGYQYEHAYLETMKKDIFENKFKFLFNYFYNKENMFTNNKAVSDYLIKNNNIGLKFSKKGRGYLLLELNKNPLNVVKSLLNENFTFYLITDFNQLGMVKKLNVNLGDIYSLSEIKAETMQVVNYFIRTNKITKKQFENTKKYYSSIIHVMDENCELQQISLEYLDFDKDYKSIIYDDYIQNLFWLQSFEKMEFNLNDNKYLEKYLLLMI